MPVPGSKTDFPGRSGFGGYCCKSRKSNGTKNSAKVFDVSIAAKPRSAVYTRSCGELFANIAATSAARFPTRNRHQPLYKRVPRGSQSSVNENASSTNLDVAAVAGGLRRASEFNMTSGIDGFAAEAIANNLA